MLSLRLHPRLGQAALRARADKQYRAWLVLRALDDEGNGHIPLVTARQSLCKELALSARSARRVLRDGAGRWWGLDKEAGILHLRGLASVCRSLGLERKPGAPVLVDAEQVRGLASFRSLCFGAQFANERAIDKPIAVSALAGRIGRSRRTAHSYLRLAGVRVQHNIMVSSRKPDTLDAEEARQGWHRAFVGKRLVLAKHLPNSYYLDAPTGPVGRGRKARIAGVNTRHPGGGNTRSRLRFVAAHKDPQRARRAVSRMSEGDTAYITEKPVPAPRGAPARQWDGYAKANDMVFRL